MTRVGRAARRRTLWRSMSSPWARLSLLAGLGGLLGGCTRDEFVEGFILLVIALDMREGHRSLCHPDVWTIPVVYNDEREEYISVTYDGSDACEMRFVPGDPTSTRTKYANILRPEGNIRVLVAGIDRSNTSLAADFSSEWAAAQASINQDHQQYASSAGLSGPILQFQNTNIVIDEADLNGTNTRNGAAMRTLLTSLGRDPLTFDALIVIDLDPANQQGGLVLDRRAVALGWFFAAQTGFVDVTASQWQSLARAAYHHEVGHLHGWQHHWPSGISHNLITRPELYGWTDLDGDGVVEILDPDPYGT